MNKLTELLASRRFGASAAGVVAAVFCYRYGMIDAEVAASWIERALEFYVAMIGGEHVMKVWKDKGPELVSKIPQVDEDTK